MQYRIENFVDHVGFGPLLAQLHAAEWGHLYDGPGSTWNQEVAEQEFADMQRDDLSLTLVALSVAGDLLGSISLIADDELQGFDHLTPWIASLYVVPTARGVGIASALIDAALRTATDLGYLTVYLFTSGQESYYLQRGWKTLHHTRAHGHAAVVMSRTLDSAFPT
jgi:predicted N-acetyltransferase YhbS